ncbi:polymer-forming cytoskeletal protein [Virgibacillus proomii]|uniref:polymer-forming cytoskeletal protein n=1 Tax=Virgibacillus proomii TaxID=84407 RepID=UPI001C1059FE|nr:polymer-forming cytoskeletal protein [Virgibacillus proomii]MBU5265697.1 polymer-forming cytoskeletal protein [Virgibacillus proomii]
MKRFWQNEAGYTLFLALLITVLFMILALSTVAFTMSGMKKNTAREEYVQATELADKGMQHITQEINTQLEEKLSENGMPRHQFAQILEDVLADYTCEANLVTGGTIGKYSACIDGEWEDIFDQDGSKNELRKLVPFKSVGTKKGKERTIYANIEIGAKTVPDALKYAIGSHNNCEQQKDCGRIPGEGNLFLHGGVVIKGDLKVDNHIITSNRGYALLSRDYWLDSLFPSILPSGNDQKAKLVLDGNMYTIEHPLQGRYADHINSTHFSTPTYKKHNRPEEAFLQAPDIVNRAPVQDKVKIREQRDRFYYTKDDVEDRNILHNYRIETGNQYAEEKVYPYAEDCFFWWCDEISEYRLQGTNTFRKFATEKNLLIRGNKNEFGKTTISEGMYVGGNLYIGNHSIGDNNYNPEAYDKIQMEGSIYIDGDLTIKGVDAKLNTLIYVNGDVTIQNTRINGLVNDGKEGSLIIFANGKVHISNNSVNQDEPSNIRGFFYSESDFEMFGVGSNIHISGGISARRIVLNAIRGRASYQRFEGAQEANYRYFEGREGQGTRPSRLQVIYNPDIIHTYSDLKQEEPVIYDIDPPLVKERN